MDSKFLYKISEIFITVGLLAGIAIMIAHWSLR